jgi:alkyldihydroxyacetonephosphate synthase
MPPDRSEASGDGPRHAGRIVPDAPPVRDLSEEHLDAWGFRDTEFRINAGGHVELTGARYSLSGAEMPDFLPWVRETLKIDVDLEPRRPLAAPRAPQPRCDPAFLQALSKVLPRDAITQEDAIRVRHGHGHTLEEVYRARYDGFPRVPDVVLYPSSEAQVAGIVEAAVRHGACLIPFGGGTSVTDALRCPADERRSIASVDLRRMNRIRWIDPVNRMAEIEAGAVGRHIKEQLGEHGFTLGHEPDSVELSTLGGWIATHASGMKKNRYGNIEDLLLDVRVVTPRGIVSRAAPGPRESVSADPRRWLLGSEGSLGIITSALVRISPLPECQEYGSVLFRDYDAGIAFLYELQSEGNLPASVRLMDNLQFRFGQALGPRRKGAVAKLRSRLERGFVTKLRGFSPDAMVACTLVFEGRKSEVAAQRKQVYALARKHGGLRAGSSNGARGYQLTFGIAYIRDFVMQHGVLAESFETSIPWSEAASLCAAVKLRVHAEHARLGLPGEVFITSRITQLYATGVAVYFYLAYQNDGSERPYQVFGELENAARDEILREGGALSHHHGVGKLRRHFLPRVFSEAALAWARETKRALDPHNVFGGGNGAFVLDAAEPGEREA